MAHKGSTKIVKRWFCVCKSFWAMRCTLWFRIVYVQIRCSVHLVLGWLNLFHCNYIFFLPNSFRISTKSRIKLSYKNWMFVKRTKKCFQIYANTKYCFYINLQFRFTFFNEGIQTKRICLISVVAAACLTFYKLKWNLKFTL